MKKNLCLWWENCLILVRDKCTNHPLINAIFWVQVSGFFVEAGALDGYILSNTLSLEKIRAWSGLLVEPRPDMFQELLQKQRKAFAARFCLSEKPYLYKVQLVFSFLLRSHRAVLWIFECLLIFMVLGIKITKLSMEPIKLFVTFTIV